MACRACRSACRHNPRAGSFGVVAGEIGSVSAFAVVRRTLRGCGRRGYPLAVAAARVILAAVVSSVGSLVLVVA